MIRAAQGDASAVRELVTHLLPSVRTRIGVALYRHRALARRRVVEQEVDDMAQEVFAALFEDGARVLSSWDPEKGLALHRFVGLVAERTAGAILRSGVRTPWRDDPTEDVGVDVPDEGWLPSTRAESADFARRLLQALRVELTPAGYRAFEVLFLEEADVEAACKALGSTPESIYAWRSRLAKTVRRVAEELDAEGPGAAR